MLKMTEQIFSIGELVKEYKLLSYIKEKEPCFTELKRFCKYNFISLNKVDLMVIERLVKEHYTEDNKVKYSITSKGEETLRLLKFALKILR